MAYPRKCEVCGSVYTATLGFAGFPHITLAAYDGGTASPWVPDKPGRVLDLGCRLCGGIFRWDYFGGATNGSSRLGRCLGILRGPVPGWRPGSPFGAVPRFPRQELVGVKVS